MNDCPNAALCGLLGRHIHGREYEIWSESFTKRPLSPERCLVYRKAWAKEARVPLSEAYSVCPWPGDPPLPSKLTMIGNFAVAVKEHVKAGMPKASPEVQAERKAICEGCELFRHSDKRCSHEKCGCFMVEKWAWAEQKCPLGKW